MGDMQPLHRPHDQVSSAVRWQPAEFVQECPGRQAGQQAAVQKRRLLTARACKVQRLCKLTSLSRQPAAVLS